MIIKITIISVTILFSLLCFFPTWRARRYKLRDWWKNCFKWNLVCCCMMLVNGIIVYLTYLTWINVNK